MTWGIFMPYSQQRELKLYGHIIGCFCQVNTPWSPSKYFPFSFLLIVHLLWYQLSVCAPVRPDGPSMKHLLAGQGGETWVNSTNQWEEKRRKKQTWLTRYVDVTAYPLAFCRLWTLRIADSWRARGKPAQKTELQEVPQVWQTMSFTIAHCYALGTAYPHPSWFIAHPLFCCFEITISHRSQRALPRRSVLSSSSKLGKSREEEEEWWCVDVAQCPQTKTFLWSLSYSNGPLCPAAEAGQQMARKVKKVVMERG